MNAAVCGLWVVDDIIPLVSWVFGSLSSSGRRLAFRQLGGLHCRGRQATSTGLLRASTLQSVPSGARGARFLFWPAHTWASFQRPPATTRHAFLAAANSALERYRCTAPRRALCFPQPVYVAASRLAEPVGCERWTPWRLSAADTCARRRNARVDTLSHPLGNG